MAKWTAKEMVLNIASTKEAILFMEALQKQIKIVDIIADYFPGKVTIRFEGAKENLKEALELTKNLHQMIYAMLYPDKEGFYDYNIIQLTKITGKTFPLKVLLKILELKNFDTIRNEEDFFLSKIDYDSLIEIITLIDKTLADIPYEISTTSLRDIITIISVSQGLSNNESIAKAKKAKIILEDDLQRLKLAFEPEQALEKVLKKS